MNFTRKKDRHPEVNLSPDYRYTQQTSNSAWYDTSAHVLGFALWGTW